MVFFAMMGTNIKPTAIFILLSIIFVEICVAISKAYKHKNLPKINIKLLIGTVLTTIGAVLLSLFITMQVTTYDVAINEDESFSAAHFAMMGLSYENRGAWNRDDVNFSRSFKTCEERDKGNIEETINRIKNLGPIGIFSIYLNKTMTNYGDATFA